jgi:UDP-N-acetylglucosamine 2-epimerase (non-hydrolysing)
MSGRSLKVLLVVGARPNFMKAAPLAWEMSCRPECFAFSLVHTGQHYDIGMSEVFIQELDLPEPDLNLEVGSGSHALQTGQVMIRFEPVAQRLAPDWVVVVGDVNSTLACTLVAVKLGLRVAHFDRTMPEEVNRVATDALAHLLLTPSPDADLNLEREGIPASRIRRVGNVMIDTVVRLLPRARERRTHESLGLKPGRFTYVTLHRPSNVDDDHTLAGIGEGLGRIAARQPLVFAVHPRTRRRLDASGLARALADAPGVRLIEPLGYLDSLCLTEQAGCVLTDSGGLQEETSYLGVPCLTLRPNTERPITISEGTNRLTSIASLPADFEAALARRATRDPAPSIPLWDGHAARRIVDCLVETTPA